jgi:hypothetical protein
MLLSRSIQVSPHRVYRVRAAELVARLLHCLDNLSDAQRLLHCGPRHGLPNVHCVRSPDSGGTGSKGQRSDLAQGVLDFLETFGQSLPFAQDGRVDSFVSLKDVRHVA